MNISYLIFPIIFVCLIIISLDLINNSYGQVNESQTLRTYENPDIQLRFSYPVFWGNIIEEGEEDCSDKSSCILNLESSNSSYRFIFSLFAISKETCDCTSLMDNVKNSYNYQASSFDDFSFISDNETMIGKNNSGWQYDYSYSAQGENLTGHSIFFTNNITYYIIAIAYPEESRAKLIPDLKRLIGSVDFLPVQNKVTKIPSFMNASEIQQLKVDKSSETNTNDLEILSRNSFTDSLGYMHVVGEIKNNSPSTVTFVKITGTYYDANNQVVGTEFAYADPYDLVSGQTAPFEILLLSASIPISQIDRYTLQASSD